MTKTGQAQVQTCDVLVIGGGPGGSTVATLLARKGWAVIVLEKAHHPRFHIGESLLPMNLPIFERLGVMDKVAALGVRKLAADFEADNERGYNQFEFSRALGDSPGHAFQVCRAGFDAMLFEHARNNGVDAREGEKVTAVTQQGPRESLIEVRREDGSSYRIGARYVVDASGRDALLANRRKLIRRNSRHQGAAVFAHFRGAQFRPSPDTGNISIYRFGHGWMWMIPQPGDMMSVGVVCRPEYLRQRGADTHDFLFKSMRSNSALWSRMKHARLIDDKVHVVGNYAYDSTQMAGPGWMLIGDAFAFLDPVFSSGVFLAMAGAEQAAEVVDAALHEPNCERALQKRMETRLRTGMRRFAWFIYRFNTPAMRDLFRAPRNTFNVERGVISMLAGDVFDAPRVWRRLMMFKFIYAIQVLLNPACWGRRNGARQR